MSEEARVSVTQVWLDQNEPAKQAGLYRVNNEEAGVLPVSRFRNRIEQKKDYLQEKWDLLGSEDSDVWRENYERNTYDEASMLNSLHNDAPLFCAMDIPGLQPSLNNSNTLN